MPRPVPRVTTWLRHVAAWWAATTAVLLAAALLLGVGTGPAAAQAPPAIKYEILAPTAEEMADVRPGELVDVRIQVPPRTSVSGIRFCPAEAPDPTGGPDAINAACAEAPRTPAYASFYSSPDGLIEFTTVIPPVGGEVVLPADPNGPAGAPPRLRCGVGDTCRLVMGLSMFDAPSASNSQAFLFSDPQLLFTPQPAASLEGCAFPGAAAIDALGPDRLSRQGVAWARDRCLAAGSAVDLTYTGLPDAAARDLLRQGDGDVFFSAGGVNTPAFLAETGTTPPDRAVVPIPVALNAAVVAVSGNYGVPYPDDPGYEYPRRLTDLTITAEELAVILTRSASLLVSGAEGLQSSYDDPSLPDVGAGYRDPARNPEVAELSPFGLNSEVGGPAAPDPATWVLSRYLEAGAPAYWRYPNTPNAGGDAGRPVGTRATLQPLTYSGGTTDLFSDRNGLLRFLNDLNANCGGLSDGCLHYVLTDAATAAELRLPVAQVENGSGAFVAPTPDSLAAAAAGMEAAADGSLVARAVDPDPTAYPLPIVEYANVAVDLCGEVQGTAKNFARYLITGGQAPELLGEGLLPLPAALRDEAEAAVARLEALPDTPCPVPAPPAPPQPAPAPPPAPAPAPAAAAGSGGGSGSSGSGSAAAGGSATRPAAGATAPAATAPAPATPQAETPRVPAVEDRAQARAAADEIDIPGFSGAARLGAAPPLAALALLAALPAGTASASANWSPARPAIRRRLRLPGPRRG